MKTKSLFCLMAILWCFVSCNENDVPNDIEGGRPYYYGFPCHAHNLLTVVSEIPFGSSGYDIEKVLCCLNCFVNVFKMNTPIYNYFEIDMGEVTEVGEIMEKVQTEILPQGGN